MDFENEDSFGYQIKPIIKYVVSFIIVCIVSIIINTYVMAAAKIPTESMYPALKEGDLVLFSKISINHIKKGDVIIFRDIIGQHKYQYISKRVIATEGDKLQIKDNALYLNDIRIAENYINNDMKTKDLSVTVPKDSFFVMGDNRNLSFDSRFWDNKFVNRKDILGKIVMIAFPFTHIRISI